MVHSPPTLFPVEQTSVSPGSFLAQMYLSTYVIAVGLLEGEDVGPDVGLFVTGVFVGEDVGPDVGLFVTGVFVGDLEG